MSPIGIHYLAEAYVLRNRKKLKEAEEEKRERTTVSKSNGSSGCCFNWFSKKKRRTTKPSTRNINEKEPTGDPTPRPDCNSHPFCKDVECLD